MQSSPRYHLAPDLSVTELDNEVVILNLQNGQYFGLNHVGQDLIEHFKAEQTLESAINMIAEKYQIPNHQAEQDIQQLTTQLLENQLLIKS